MTGINDFPRLTILHREDKTKPRNHQKSNDAEHFRDVELVEAIAREVAQNSLDAMDRGPVSLSIDLKPLPKKAKSVLPEVTNGAEHWVKSGLKIPFTTGKALILEDNGTTGLRGDIDLDTSDADSWAYFFHSFGETGKKEVGKSGGSFGLGKVVLTLASQSATFFAYTHDGRTTRFMGISQLPPRSVEGKPYLQASYLAAGISRRGFATPLEGKHADMAAAALGLAPRTESGTTIVILDPRKAVSSKKADRLFADTLAPLVCLRGLKVRLFGKTLDETKLTELGSPETAAQITAIATCQPIQDLVIDSVSDKWIEDNAASLKRGAKLRLISRTKPDFFLDAWIQEAPKAKDGVWKALRQSVVVGPPRATSRPGWVILLDITSPELSRFLVSQEGPSHQSWTPSRAKGEPDEIEATNKLLRGASALAERASRPGQRSKRVSMEWASKLFGASGHSNSKGSGTGKGPVPPKPRPGVMSHQVSMSSRGDVEIRLHGEPGSKAKVSLLVYPTGKVPQTPLDIVSAEGCFVVESSPNTFTAELTEEYGVLRLSEWDLTRVCTAKLELA